MYGPPRKVALEVLREVLREVGREVVREVNVGGGMRLRGPTFR